MKKSKIENVKLEQQLITELPLIDTTSSQPFTKPHVVRRLEDVMSKFGEAHNMMAGTKLSKEEYQPISSLMATAKVELFNIYYELKNQL